jgi:HEAT repeat protein
MTMSKLFAAALVWGLSAYVALAAAGNQNLSELFTAASSGDEPARLRAIDTLGERNDVASQVIPILSKQLKDRSAMVRAHAAHALGQLGPAARPAVAALAPLLADPEVKVRRAAVRAWLRIGPDPQAATPLLSNVLKDADPAVRTGALEILATIGTPAVPALVKALKQEKVAYWACLALAEIGPAAAPAVPALIEVLKTDTRPEVRREAALALGAIGPAAAIAVPALIEALGDSEVTVAAGAAYALGRSGAQAKPAEAALAKCMKSPSVFLRTVGVWAWAKLDPRDEARQQKAVTLLAAALNSKEPRVRHAAVHGLIDLDSKSERMFPAIKQALRAADKESLSYAIEALESLGPPAVPILIDALRHENIRPLAASVLGHIGPAAKEAAPALADIVSKDKDVHARCEALLALGGIGPGAAIGASAAADALTDPEERVRYSACYALGKMGPAAVTVAAELQKRLKDKDPTVALAGAWALAKIDPQCPEATQSLPVLMRGLTDPDPRLRLEAAIALRCLGPAAKEAAPLLIEAARRDKDELVRDMAAQALAALAQ